MREYVGCKAAKEISKVKNPANKLSTHLVSKADKKPADPKEDDPMPMTAEDIAKASAAGTAAAISIALMDDVTKAHMASLDDEGRVAFLAKSSDVQKSEAAAAKKAKDDEAAAAELAKSGKTASEAALQKKVDEQAAQLADLQKRETERTATAEIEKQARSPEFDGFPGGEAKLVPLLKSAAKLDEDERVAYVDSLKSQAATAKRLGTAYGVRPSEEDIQKRAPATARIEKAAKELAAEKSIPYDDAFVAVIEKHEFAEDVAAMQRESH